MFQILPSKSPQHQAFLSLFIANYKLVVDVYLSIVAWFATFIIFLFVLFLISVCCCLFHSWSSFWQKMSSMDKGMLYKFLIPLKVTIDVLTFSWYCNNSFDVLVQICGCSCRIDIEKFTLDIPCSRNSYLPILYCANRLLVFSFFLFILFISNLWKVECWILVAH